MKAMWLMVGCGMLLAAQNPDDALRAQKKAEALADEAKKVAFNGQTFAFVSAQLVSGPPVKGAPYSAEAVNETIQTLADGNRIVQHTSAMQYRDNDGRERREETSAMGAIFITDPVAETRYTLHPETRTAEKGGPAVLRFSTTSAGPAGNQFFYVNSGGTPGGRSGAAEQGLVVEHTEAGLGRGLVITTARTGGRGAPSNESAKTEQLGNMYIEGVQAQGTRETTTIPAGTIGNERPINIVDERWYSPDLQMTIMTKHSDPRMGETTFQLKNINRSSPPPYLFEVPSDYTVMTAGAGRNGRSGGPGPVAPAGRSGEQRK